MSRTGAVWNALIRTHHITSRKKVAKLKQAAGDYGVFVLLRSGGAPGIMFVAGSQDGVEKWVNVVQRLRYKDYHLASRPGVAVMEIETESAEFIDSGFFETESVKDFGLRMEQRGVRTWWRRAMGYERSD